MGPLSRMHVPFTFFLIFLWLPDCRAGVTGLRGYVRSVSDRCIGTEAVVHTPGVLVDGSLEGAQLLCALEQVCTVPVPSCRIAPRLGSCSLARTCWNSSKGRTQTSGRGSLASPCVICFMQVWRYGRPDVHGKLIMQQLHALFRQAFSSTISAPSPAPVLRRLLALGPQRSRQAMQPSNSSMHTAVPIEPAASSTPASASSAAPIVVRSAFIRRGQDGAQKSGLESDQEGRLGRLSSACNVSTLNFSIFEGTIAEAAERVASLASQSHIAILLSEADRHVLMRQFVVKDGKIVVLDGGGAAITWRGFSAWLPDKERPATAFSNATAVDKTAVVRAGKVGVNGVELVVKWIGNFTNGSKTITSVEDSIGGKVSLSDGTAFENPAAKGARAFSISGNSQLCLVNVTLDGEGGGGALQAWHATKLLLRNVTVQNCQTHLGDLSTHGAAVKVDGALMDASQALFLNNTSAKKGGCVNACLHMHFCVRLVLQPCFFYRCCVLQG